MKKISKYLTLFLLLLFFNVINVDADNLENSIQCSVHVQYNGWMSYVDNGEICGTVGASKRMESFIINKNISNVDGDVLYKSYVEGVGWQDYVSSGNMSGTEGKSKRIEMIKIKLDGEMADKYDIYPYKKENLQCYKLFLFRKQRSHQELEIKQKLYICTCQNT